MSDDADGIARHAEPVRLHTFLWLSIFAALATMGLKLAAWGLTGSVSLLSDALESVVNLAAAVVAFLAVRYAERPADQDHAYGHEKIEYFSSGLEGGLVLLAGVSIIWVAVERLVRPQERLDLDIGLLLAGLASLINLAVAVVLIRVGKARDSIAVEAGGRHLMSDVWTSGGILVGLGLVWFTGWKVLDPVMALLVAIWILWIGFDLMRRSFHGLMDRSLPDEEVRVLRETVQSFLGPEMAFHALRTRQSGPRRFADFHLLVPGAMTVQAAHDLANQIEAALAQSLPAFSTTIHVEPIEDRTSHEDLVIPPAGQVLN